MAGRIRWAMAALAIGGLVVAITTSRRAAVDTIGAAAGVPLAAPAPAPASADGAPVAPPVLAAGPAPSVGGATGWLNSPALGDTDLAGHVVLYQFWTFGCVNCRNTLPAVRAWHDRYADDGLVIVAIHSPEFDHEADPGNVAEFVTANDITYPVALDPDRTIWRAWDNHYWPAFYLHDGQGRLRLRHYGEGSYDQTEDAIRSLLGVDPASPRATVG